MYIRDGIYERGVLPVPYRVENGELELPPREEILELMERHEPGRAKRARYLYVKGVHSILRVGPSVVTLDFDRVSIEECPHLLVFDAPVPCKGIVLAACVNLRTVRAHALECLIICKNPDLVCIDALGAPGKVVVDACNALAFMRGVDRARGLSVFGKHDRRSALLYIAGASFDGLEIMPHIYERVVTAAPWAGCELWRRPHQYIVDNEPHVPEWYTVARRKMGERTWLTLAWRALTGDKDVTGLAHADLLRRAILFL